MTTPNKFFVGCHHFLHERALADNHRDYASVEAMAEDFIEKHNAKVKPNDIVYHLGDFAVPSSTPDGKSGKEKTLEVFERLNGKFYVIFGDHDSTFRQLHGKFLGSWDLTRKNIDGLWFHMCHFPLCYWERHGSNNSIHIHSHSHGRGYGALGTRPNELILDVGIDNAKKVLGDYEPFSLEDVKAFLRKKKYWERNGIKPTF